jgi:hypothetical protein
VIAAVALTRGSTPIPRGAPAEMSEGRMRIAS